MVDGDKKPFLNRWLHRSDGHHAGHLTPPGLVEALGKFDLDPCGAVGHELTDRTYLRENGQDGLTEPWEGRVWLNPPHGEAASLFLARLAEHGCGIALISARTNAHWFHQQVWEKASGILFLKERVEFLCSDGTAEKHHYSPPSCLVAYGQKDAAVLRRIPLPGQYVNLED